MVSGLTSSEAEVEASVTSLALLAVVPLIGGESVLSSACKWRTQGVGWERAKIRAGGWTTDAQGSEWTWLARLVNEASAESGRPQGAGAGFRMRMTDSRHPEQLCVFISKCCPVLSA